MDVSTIQALGAFPLTEMDRQGVSGDKGSLPWSAGLGFEQSLLALLVPPGAQAPMADLASASSKPFEFAEGTNAFQIPMWGGLAQNSAKTPSNVINFNKLGMNPNSMMEFVNSSQVATDELPNSKDGAEVQAVKGLAKEALLQNVSGNSHSQAGQIQGVQAQASLGKNQNVSQEPNMDIASDEGLSEELKPVGSLQKDLPIKGEIPGELKLSSSNKETINRPLGLKNMADTLYIQQHLSSEVPFSMQEMKAELNSEVVQQHEVRQNLVQDMQSFVTRIVETNEGGSISLKLRPGNLGEVQVKVDVSSENVRIHMETSSTSAEHLLKSQSNELKQQLQNVGLRVEELQISSQRLSDSAMDQKNGQGSERDAQQFAHQHKKQERDSEGQFLLDENGLHESREA